MLCLLSKNIHEWLPAVNVTTRLPHVCRTKYVGEGSAACMLGLFTGVVVLMLQRYLTEDSLHQLLTFNPADFFT